MKNVYGYIRVSTKKQGDGVSPEVQRDAIAQYAIKNNLNIIEWFEEKKTAAKQGRPLFTNMMKLLTTKKADGVIIHKIDRGARNWGDWVDVTALVDAGYEMHFAHESLDMNTRGGRLSADIQVAVAVDYIRNLKQEAIKGLYGRLKQGIYPFQAPLGYIDTGKGKVKEVHPVQSVLVRKAFELYATREHSLDTLSEKMYELGLRNRKGKRVFVNSLSIILNNPYYMGIIKVKHVEFNGGHEPIITPELFNRVQTILRANNKPKVAKHDFKFRKLLICKGCGYTLAGEMQKGHIYYRCHTKNCITKGIKERTLDNLLQKAFATAQLIPEESEILKELFTETEKAWIVKHNNLVEAIKLQKGQIAQKLERLTDCYLEGGLDKDTYADRKGKLLIESKTKEAVERDLLQNKGGILKKIEKFFELGKDLIKSYENGIFEEKVDLLKIATSNLVVEGKKLVITMRSPFLELSKRHDFHFCPPTRGGSRKEGSKLIYCEENTSPIICEPLSKEQLRLLLDEILAHASELPDLSDE